jgi:CubicO group peptidase (beta-lactamase class C family)
MKNLFTICIPFLFIAILLLASTSCAQEAGSSIKKILIKSPQQMNDGLLTGKLSESGIDSIKLLKILERINDNEYQAIHSILIMKDGRLVFEEYFPGYDFDYNAKEFKGNFIEHDYNTIHNLASVTKSVTSLLFGIAVDKGLIKGVNEKLYTFYPQDSAHFSGSKKNITLQNLLTMSSGLEWNENDIPYGNITNDIIQLFIVPDPLKYILSKPLKEEPGTKFYYNGGGTNLLGNIVQRTSGLRLDDFAQKYLFDPLGIKLFKWVYINPGFVYSSGDLRVRPRDMAKLGLLVLNKGVYNGNQVISKEWIEQMITKHVFMPNDEGYGYQWWIKKYKLGKKSFDSYYAAGWGGQRIMVFPELNTIVVFTCGNYSAKDPAQEIIYRYILPSIDKDFDYDLKAIENAAPLPEEIVITKPDDQIGENLSAFSGSWYGEWDYLHSCQLVIEKINNSEAEVIYSWADHPQGYFQKGWMRKTAKINSSGGIEFENNNAAWKFNHDKSEDVLIGFYKDQYVDLKMIMKHKK